MTRDDQLFRRMRHNRIYRLVLFGTPLALVAVELAHPVLDAVHPVTMLKPILEIWLLVHLLLMPLFALSGWAFFVLLEGVKGWAARIAKGAACVYAVLAIGYEAAIGLGSGMLTLSALGAPLGEQHLIERILSRMILSPLFDYLAIMISMAAFFSVLCSILALWRARAPRWPLLVMFGAFGFVLAHESPFGPCGNFCFFTSSILLEMLWSPATRPAVNDLPERKIWFSKESTYSD